MTDWTGDLDDDCTLERYGMHAHVECMHRGCWWFGVYRGEWPNETELCNTSDFDTPVRLTTGKMARAAAECVMEILRRA
jgi:hypothetical protein